MKKTNVFILLFLFLFISLNNNFSQGTSIGYYDGEQREYFKKKLKIYYIPERINDQTYITDINNFVASKNGLIDSVYTVFSFTIGEVTFTSSESDALILIDEFIQSNLFQHVRLRSEIRPN